jgi:acetate kinase
MKILVINSGSSSIKYKLFDMPKKAILSKGIIEHVAEKGSKIKSHQDGIKLVLSKINSVDVIGHRVVHGAESFTKPVLINDKVLRQIKKSCSVAPLHNPANLTGIIACKKLLPRVKQVAVFDTAFHQTLPDYAFIYGLPYEFYSRLRVRKYGFHGTSHEYVAGEAAKILGRPLRRLKLITCHLGNGCSIAAIRGGKSIDTSMGFTPLEGLVMGTRCGDIDPALITYIMQKKNIPLKDMDYLLNHLSGLKGISGLSNDMRTLEEKARKGNKRAELAVDVFVYRVKKYIGSYIAILSGCDAVVFTAGIGENQKRVRNNILKGLFTYLKKKPRILVIPTDEELMIAIKACNIIKG